MGLCFLHLAFSHSQPRGLTTIATSGLNKIMPVRITPLVNNEIYHIYNRSISLTPAFVSKRDYQRILEILSYYQFAKTPLSFSKFKKLSIKERTKLLEKLNKENNRLAKILCFCIMPNHFHLLLKQTKEDGISKLVANFQNSYTRYFNLKNKRIGPLFQGVFKAVRIETGEQLIHVSRYIHLNPYSSLMIKTLGEVEDYPWSSLREYFYPSENQISFPKEILSFFKDSQQYKKFVFDQADYQREIEKIKHLTLE